jgi:hypothetical protein
MKNKSFDVFSPPLNKEWIFVFMKKMIQRAKIHNEENVPYLHMDNEDSFLRSYQRIIFVLLFLLFAILFLIQLIPYRTTIYVNTS